MSFSLSPPKHFPKFIFQTLPRPQAETFSLESYDHASIKAVFESIKATWPDGRLKTAVWNTGQWSTIPFMEIKESDIKLSVQINMCGPPRVSSSSREPFAA